MGMLTDLFVATKSEARKYDKLLNDNEVDIDALYPRASHKGITGIELSLLWASMIKEPLSAKHFFKPVSSESDDGITELLPQPFIKLLASTPEGSLEQLATAWSSEPDITLTPLELTPLLRDLTSLARRAVSTKKDLFIWYCP